jgi:hypothetical protein
MNNSHTSVVESVHTQDGDEIACSAYNDITSCNLGMEKYQDLFQELLKS